MTVPRDCDLLIVGGGLAGGLIARAFAEQRPDVRILLVERDAGLGGNHIWSFFDGDIDPADRWLVDPMIAHRWAEGHEVRFPGRKRKLDAAYNSITSDRFDAVLRAGLPDRILSGEVAELRADGAVLADGRHIMAGAVIDARGQANLSALHCGWQKFAGHRLRLTAAHGVDRPVIMDAAVDQLDGYRFVYLLPMGPETIFVEDTYYSDTPDIDPVEIGARIQRYAAMRGWTVAAVEHREIGVLPVVHGGDFDAFWPKDDPVARAGVRAGLFHPMTGYSLPDAVAFALHLARAWPVEGGALAGFTRHWAAAHWRRGGYYRLLGKMLFHAAVPDRRWRIFQRFYGLPEPLIGRFYAGRSTIWDKLRILCGRPPVPIRGAMRAVMKTR